MELMNKENVRLIEYGAAGIGSFIAAGYLSNYLQNNMYELIGGAAALGGSVFLIKGTSGIKGPLKLFGVVIGLLFLARGILGFVPDVRKVVDSYTMNIL